MLAFKRLIAVTVMLSLFGLSTAWAFDGHGAGDAAGCHEAHESANPLHDDGSGCGHVCHAGAHLFGLDPAPGPASIVPRAVPRPALSAVVLVSRTTAPPLKPPQS